MDLQPQQKLGDYTILRKLAEGGMAEIYLATRAGASGFSKTCVLKRVRKQHRTDGKFREMFESEARLAANLEHAHIVQIFDFQSDGAGELYLAMQYVEGGSLEQLREKVPGGRLPPYLAAKITRDVASALHYAFTARGPDGQPLRLVHRDISPHNVLVSVQGEVKLTDFGIAKPSNKQTSGGFKGKIAYMAPEQARGDQVDARTDLFALGVVLFELLTGERPYAADNDVAFVYAMATMTDPPPRADALNPDLPKPLVALLETAVQRRPEDRFQTATEFIRALDGFLRQAPPQAELDLVEFMASRGIALGPDEEEPVDARAPTLARQETLRSDPGLAPATQQRSRSGATSVATSEPRTGQHAPQVSEEAASRPTSPAMSAVRARPQPASDFTGKPTSQPAPVRARPAPAREHESRPAPAVAPVGQGPAQRRAALALAAVALPLGFFGAYQLAKEPAPTSSPVISVAVAPQGSKPKLEPITLPPPAVVVDAGLAPDAGPVQVAALAAEEPKGRAHFTAVPYAAVEVEGHRCSETPCEVPLAPGRHTATFDFNGTRRKQAFVVLPGKRVEVSITFE